MEPGTYRARWAPARSAERTKSAERLSLMPPAQHCSAPADLPIRRTVPSPRTIPSERANRSAPCTPSRPRDNRIAINGDATPTFCRRRARSQRWQKVNRVTNRMEAIRRAVRAAARQTVVSRTAYRARRQAVDQSIVQKREAPTYPPGPRREKRRRRFNYSYGASDETSPVHIALGVVPFAGTSYITSRCLAQRCGTLGMCFQLHGRLFSLISGFVQSACEPPPDG